MKRFFFIAAVAVSAVFITSCNKNDDPDNSNSATTDVGVVINGVKWATRNVDAFGTFAATPESAGMFYQWNRKKAWSATEPGLDIAIGADGGWDETVPAGTTWEKVNDPCPKGWRVPTKEELQSLLDKSKVTNESTTQSGVTGNVFTDIATGNTLFMPAIGFRRDDGTLRNVGVASCYWSSTAHESYETQAYIICPAAGTSENLHRLLEYPRRRAVSVRAVAE